MNYRKVVASGFILLSLVLGAIFYSQIVPAHDLGWYFQIDNYNQFGPLAICVELLIAGYFLFIHHTKANFTLALFGFTVVADVLFNLTGLFTSLVPTYAIILFVICAIVSLWLAFSDTFNLGRISLLEVLGSLILGIAVEFFFNGL